MTGYIGGLSSGLDTASMIEQLLQVERAPLRRLQQTRQQMMAKDDAWTGVSTRLSSLRTALDELATQAEFDQLITAESSHPERLTVNVSGAAEPQTLTLTVDRLATRHELVSAGGFASADSLVGAGTFSVTVDGVTHDISTDASTTLSDLAASINALDAGVQASVIRLDGSTAELRLVSSETGAASTFSASGDQAVFATFDVVRAGQDAQLTMGTMTLRRSTNTIDDLVPGVTLDLVSAGPEEVTVTTGRDVEGAVTGVKEVVDELNGVITHIKQLTAYDAGSGRGGPLLGDGTARRILMDLQSAVTSFTTDHPTYGYAGSIGIEIQRDGTINLDETKLRAALEDDFQAVSRLLSRSGQVSGSDLDYVYSSESTVDGTYSVEITQAAAVASVSGAAYASPTGDIAFQITSGSVTADVTVTAGSTLAEAIAAINSSLDAAGIATVGADDDGGAIRLRESRYGSARSFSVAGSGTLGLDGSFQGTDVEGTVGGEPASGTGQSLTVESGDPDRLIVEVHASQAEVDGAGGLLVVGDVTVGSGLVGVVSRAVAAAEGMDGSIRRARDHWDAQIEMVDERIDAFEDRLIGVEERLIREFTAMEQALARLQSQQAWMSAQLGSLG